MVRRIAGHRHTVSEGSRDNSHEDEAFTEGKVQQIVNSCRLHTSLRRVNSSIMQNEGLTPSSNLNAVCIIINSHK